MFNLEISTWRCWGNKGFGEKEILRKQKKPKSWGGLDAPWNALRALPAHSPATDAEFLELLWPGQELRAAIELLIGHWLPLRNWLFSLISLQTIYKLMFFTQFSKNFKLRWEKLGSVALCLLNYKHSEISVWSSTSDENVSSELRHMVSVKCTLEF